MQKKERYSRMITIGFFAFLLSFAIGSVLLADEELSKTERRHYAKMPKLRIETLTDKSFMDDLEAYLLDHFAGREFFRTLKTEVEIGLFGKADANSYVEFEGYLLELDFNWKKSNVKRTAKMLAELTEEWFPDAEVYYAVIPDKTYFLPGESYPDTEDEWVLSQLKEQLTGAGYIDLYPLLTLEDYYRTDLHWRQEKITDVAELLLEKMKADRTNEKYEKQLVTSEFYGGYAGASAYPVKAETMYALTNDTIEKVTVYDYELQQETEIYADEKLSGMDAYDYYLGGARALLTIRNPYNKNGKKLLLFRDSFGSSIAPLLLEGYEEMTLVDLRYISGTYLPALIDTKSYDDVLLLYSQRVLHHSDSFK